MKMDVWIFVAEFFLLVGVFLFGFRFLHETVSIRHILEIQSMQLSLSQVHLLEMRTVLSAQRYGWVRPADEPLDLKVLPWPVKDNTAVPETEKGVGWQ